MKASQLIELYARIFYLLNNPDENLQQPKDSLIDWEIYQEYFFPALQKILTSSRATKLGIVCDIPDLNFYRRLKLLSAGFNAEVPVDRYANLITANEDPKDREKTIQRIAKLTEEVMAKISTEHVPPQMFAESGYYMVQVHTAVGFKLRNILTGLMNLPFSGSKAADGELLQEPPKLLIYSNDNEVITHIVVVSGDVVLGSARWQRPSVRSAIERILRLFAQQPCFPTRGFTLAELDAAIGADIGLANATLVYARQRFPVLAQILLREESKPVRYSLRVASVEWVNESIT